MVHAAADEYSRRGIFVLNENRIYKIYYKAGNTDHVIINMDPIIIGAIMADIKKDVSIKKTKDENVRNSLIYDRLDKNNEADLKEDYGNLDTTSKSDEFMAVGTEMHAFAALVLFTGLITGLYMTLKTYIHLLNIPDIHWTVLTWNFVNIIGVIIFTFVVGNDYYRDPEWYWSYISFMSKDLIDFRYRRYNQSIYDYAYNHAYNDVMDKLELSASYEDDEEDNTLNTDMDQENTEHDNLEVEINIHDKKNQ